MPFGGALRGLTFIPGRGIRGVNPMLFDRSCHSVWRDRDGVPSESTVLQSNGDEPVNSSVRSTVDIRTQASEVGNE